MIRPDSSLAHLWITSWSSRSVEAIEPSCSMYSWALSPYACRVDATVTSTSLIFSQSADPERRQEAALPDSSVAAATGAVKVGGQQTHRNRRGSTS